MPMKGWVTWVGVAGMLALGFYNIVIGNVEEGAAFFAAAVGLFGIGRKIEKPK